MTKKDTGTCAHHQTTVRISFDASELYNYRGYLVDQMKIAFRVENYEVAAIYAAAYLEVQAKSKKLPQPDNFVLLK